MQQFKRILFVANGASAERSALAQATAIAESNRAELLTVVDTQAGHSIDDAGSPSGQEDSREAHGSEPRYLLSTAPVLRLPDCPQVKVETGQSLPAVIEAAKQYDLVIKAAHERSSRLLHILGGEDAKLMRKCACSVCIVKPSRHGRRRSILAAVDLDPRMRESASFARLIMEQAIALARHGDAILHVVHAWDIWREVELRGRIKVAPLLHEMEKAHQKQLDCLLSGYSFPHIVAHLIKGRAGDVIPELARRRRVDLLVIGSGGRPGLRQLMAGRTAEKVLSACDCSVLAVKQHVAQSEHDPVEARPPFQAPGRSAATRSTRAAML